jgi:hypothetical protein
VVVERAPSWAALKAEYALVVDGGDALWSDAALQITETVARSSDSCGAPVGELAEDGVAKLSVAMVVDDGEEPASVSVSPLENIELSVGVVRWLDQAETHLRRMFLKRIQQLAEGQRSYALSKRLQYVGACPMFESKLDKGMRILWTLLERDRKHSILVRSLSMRTNSHFISLT